MSVTSLWTYATPELLRDVAARLALPGLVFAGLLARHIRRMERSTVEVPAPMDVPQPSVGVGSWTVEPDQPCPVGPGRVVERPRVPAGRPSPQT